MKFYFSSLCFVISFLFCQSLLAQLNEDSLLLVANSTDNDSIKYEQFFRLVKAFKFYNLEKVETYADSIHALYKRTGNKKYLGISEYYLGFYYRKINQFEKAIQHSQISKQVSIDIDYPSMYAVAISQIAGIYEDQNQLVQALNINLEAVEFNKKAKDHNAQSRLSTDYNNVGLVYGKMSKYEKALEYYRLSIQNSTPSDDKSYPIGNIAEIYLELEMWDSMKVYANQCYEINVQLNEPRGIAYSEWLRASAAFAMKDFSLAESAGAEAIKIYQTYPEKVLMLDAYYILAKAQMEKGKFNEAIKNAELALNLATELDNYEFKSIGYELLSGLYEKENKLKKALSYHKLFKVSEDSLSSRIETEQLNEITIKYESAQKNEQIATQKIELAKQEIQSNRLIGGIGLLTVLSVLYFIRLRNNEKISQQEKQIQKQKIIQLEKEKKILSMNRMLEGQESERKRIAQDLHDGLGGLLATIKVKFGIIQKEIAALESLNVYQQTSSMIDDACTEVRKIAHNMMPDSLTKLGLVEAVRDIAEYTSDTDIKVINLGLHGLSETQEIMLYRVIQEFLNNTRKHAMATQIIIQFSSDEMNSIIYLEDNGKGFDMLTDTKSRGLGLKSMESRINFLGGTFELDSVRGVGTTLQIYIPKS